MSERAFKPDQSKGSGDSNKRDEQKASRLNTFEMWESQMEAISGKGFPTQMFQKEEKKETTTQKKEEEKELQAKKENNEVVSQATKSGTKAKLPDEVQTKMEGAFGTSFADVNIHKNDNSATDMGALAYTQGKDVHFAPGQYNPGTQKGQELIGHELTHVEQQKAGRVQPTAQGKGMDVNDDPKLENEADEMGKKAAEGKVVNKDVTKSNKTIQKKDTIENQPQSTNPPTPINPDSGKDKSERKDDLKLKSPVKNKMQYSFSRKIKDFDLKFVFNIYQNSGTKVTFETENRNYVNKLKLEFCELTTDFAKNKVAAYLTKGSVEIVEIFPGVYMELIAETFSLDSSGDFNLVKLKGQMAFKANAETIGKIKPELGALGYNAEIKVEIGTALNPKDVRRYKQMIKLSKNVKEHIKNIAALKSEVEELTKLHGDAFVEEKLLEKGKDRENLKFIKKMERKFRKNLKKLAPEIYNKSKEIIDKKKTIKTARAKIKDLVKSTNNKVLKALGSKLIKRFSKFLKTLSKFAIIVDVLIQFFKTMAVLGTGGKMKLIGKNRKSLGSTSFMDMSKMYMQMIKNLATGKEMPSGGEPSAEMPEPVDKNVDSKGTGKDGESSGSASASGGGQKDYTDEEKKSAEIGSSLQEENEGEDSASESINLENWNNKNEEKADKLEDGTEVELPEKEEAQIEPREDLKENKGTSSFEGEPAKENDEKLETKDFRVANLLYGEEISGVRATCHVYANISDDMRNIKGVYIPLNVVSRYGDTLYTIQFKRVNVKVGLGKFKGEIWHYIRVLESVVAEGELGRASLEKDKIYKIRTYENNQ